MISCAASLQYSLKSSKCRSGRSSLPTFPTSSRLGMVSMSGFPMWWLRWESAQMISGKWYFSSHLDSWSCQMEWEWTLDGIAMMNSEGWCCYFNSVQSITGDVCSSVECYYLWSGPYRPLIVEVQRNVHPQLFVYIYVCIPIGLLYIRSRFPAVYSLSMVY